MSRLVRLYPQAWRDRYGDEFAALLEERPPTPIDVLDTLRGALDAHLHPTVGSSEPGPWTHRLPGLVALSAGMLLSSLVLDGALRSDRAFDSGAIATFVIFAMFISLPGDYVAAHRRGIAIGIGAFILCFVLALVARWSVVGLGFYALAYLIAVCGTLALAAIRAEIGLRGRSLLLASAVMVPTIAALAISVVQNATGLALVPGGSPLAFTFLLPYGLAWVVVGLRMTVRGSPTFQDQLPRVPDPEPEVRPA